VNYDNSLVVTITMTCRLWVPSSDDHLFTCEAIFWPAHRVYRQGLGSGFRFRGSGFRVTV